jgi:hypothetical protein
MTSTIEVLSTMTSTTGCGNVENPHKTAKQAEHVMDHEIDHVDHKTSLDHHVATPHGVKSEANDRYQCRPAATRWCAGRAGSQSLGRSLANRPCGTAALTIPAHTQEMAATLMEMDRWTCFGGGGLSTHKDSEWTE